MLGRKIISLLIALFTLAAIPASTVWAATPATPGDILIQPLPGAPVIGMPGDTVEIYPAEGVTIQELQIVSILHGPYNLEIVGTENGAVKAKIPENVEPDVYFLAVKSDKGEITIPNGVWVMKKAPTVLKIAHGSDLHVTSGSKMGFVCGDYFQKSLTGILEYCKNPIALHSYTATDSFMTYYGMVGQDGTNVINIILATGDDVDTNGDRRGYELLDETILHATAAGTPFMAVKGNHDHPPKYYNKYVGPSYFYRVIGNFLIIGLDSRGEERHPDMEQLKWMEDVLKSHPDKIPIVFVHHYFWYISRLNGGVVENLTAFDDNDWQQIKKLASWDWVGRNGEYEDIARYFLQMVEKYNVRLVLSGHIHKDKPVLYIDKNGEKHWFYALTTTGAPDKTSNPVSETDKKRGYTKPSWYGSQIIYVYDNGTVEFPYLLRDIFDKDNPVSLPVPQKFIVFRQDGEDGTAVKFINELGKSISGPIALQIPAGAKVDPQATNITYTVLGEKEIGGTYYMLLNVTVPEGISQIAVVKEADTKAPEVKVGYLSPSKPKPGKAFKVYISASDNVGIRDMKVQIISDGKVIAEYPAFSMKPAEVSATYFTEVPGVDASEFTIKVIATDFYGNTGETTYTVGGTAKTTTPTTSATESTTESATQGTTGSTCGPAALVGLALVPLLLRRRK
ncbi:metallophosphoesterase [Thermococcus thioreducens]|uniref:CGP-CTERM domain-containing protein n=1 Tax=Thermococcus thioreducens TaxID=277988 RepID=A0A0Q2MRI2_9EURY|nr:metallophosphoesterase [Thermococcus thioreducens]ASJ12844.1 phosphoesterase [Thermococcus thioreducens]KQH82311.1 phosphoesterase [Thermococcus thioreducens]SEV84414.1 CGP-CTERM domain-containing protein [Thermococcus thioreducens]